MQKPKEKRKGKKDMEKLEKRKRGCGEERTERGKRREKEKASLTFMFAARVVQENEVKRD